VIYKELDILSDHPIIAELNEMREWIMSIPKIMSGRPDRNDLSSKQLLKRKTNAKNNSAYLYKFNKDCNEHPKIEHYCRKIYENETNIKDYEFVRVAKTWYPSDGYLGWHTDRDGGRLYATWAEGKSFFRYQDPISKEIITSWDTPKKWVFRIFTFDEENPLWHCVGAEDVRISVGYRFVYNSPIW